MYMMKSIKMQEEMEVNGTTASLEHMVKSMVHLNDKYIRMAQMKARPGKKEVQEGKENLLQVLTDTGKYDAKLMKQSMSNNAPNLERLKELIHEGDVVDFKDSYLSASDGEIFDLPHLVNMNHVLEALDKIINKNSSEIAIKKLFDERVSNEKGLSKQFDGIRRTAKEIIPNKLTIKALINRNGSPEEVIVQTDNIADLLAVIIAMGQLPPDVDRAYKGRIRQALSG